MRRCVIDLTVAGARSVSLREWCRCTLQPNSSWRRVDDFDREAGERRVEIIEQGAGAIETVEESAGSFESASAQRACLLIAHIRRKASTCCSTA